MKIRDYFIQALNDNAYKRKEWALDVFAINDFLEYEAIPDDKVYPYRIVKRKGNDKQIFAIMPTDNEGWEVTPIEGYTPGKPLVGLRQKLVLQPGDLVNVKSETVTTYGNAFINANIFIYPFGDKFEFQTGDINTKKIPEKVIADTLQDTPKDNKREEDGIYVDEYLKYSEAMLNLEGYAHLCVQAASEATMVPNPAVVKRRNELYAEHKEALSVKNPDPALVAKIQMELAQIDRETLKDDVSKDYYVKDKNFDVIRMKKYAMYGVEGGFGEAQEGVLVERSLDEGWDPKKMPQMIDSMRSGSYSRGKETALGGESVKTFYRIFQNVKVVEDDCGSKHGVEYAVNKDNAHRYVGLNMIDSGGKIVSVTQEAIEKYIGGKILLRSPMLCKTKAPNYCKVCVGDVLAARPEAVHIVTSDVGSAFMGARMGAMHGKALKTKPLDLDILLT